MFDRRLVVNFDIVLLIAVLITALLGVLNLKSISSSSPQTFGLYFYKQLYWICAGIIALFVLININYISIVKYSYYIHFLTVVLLVMVLLYGKTTFGAQRWLSFGGITLQPSEFAKITFILALSKFYSENISPRPFYIKDFFFPFCILLATAVPIYLQPDLGTAGMMFIIFFSISVFLNINKKSVYTIICSLFCLIPCLWFFLKEYQKKRILTFLNPELDPLNAGYQVIQSKIAVGSGGLLGKGFKMGTQSQLRFLPEQHTDFVFSVWAEEWGFLGCLVILFLYYFIIYRGLSIAYNCKNFYGSFLALGITFLVFSQFVINVFMTVGLFPVVGVPLPLFSYGGSSMISVLVGIALLININMRKFK